MKLFARHVKIVKNLFYLAGSTATVKIVGNDIYRNSGTCEDGSPALPPGVDFYAGAFRPVQ